MFRFARLSLAALSLAALIACDTGTHGPSETAVVAEAAPAMAAETGKTSLPAPRMDMMVEPSIIIDPGRRGLSTGRARARVLTAGDIDDTLNLGAFSRFVSKGRAETRLPSANFTRPMLARLTGPDGQPAPGLRVTLSRPGAAQPFYDGYSGVDGMVTVFPALHGAGGLSRADLKVFPDAQGQVVTQRIASGNRRNVALPFAGGWSPDFLDLAFVVDTTGSMADELAWLTKELSSIVSRARRRAPGVDIRYGLIVYRDDGDAYVVRNFGFTKSQSQMRSWLRTQQAAGGGDYPEAAAEALMAGANLPWRRGKGERLMFHIADAPPHDRDARAYLTAARAATQKGVQIFGLGASGVARESEYLMRQASAQSGGRYLFLTDDSGVGYGHAEPTISCYQVTKLNSLMVRVLGSELSGRRIEAAPGDVIRSVGSYQNGVCRD
ncbi:vWA domain-containing protein [Aliiroseovarius subalbicans]|uniref:vWA domain-containing protein n=1 Tax=Aliiroseovarius subalbicans TaxID=2925840 RepID=UPI001F56E96A|nr:vWA domain-containing protein [Aliiroseovarius subalbicans]MCI2399592.1 VWA domain-containing protein [Aliiroseovarius subalbicans]